MEQFTEQTLVKFSTIAYAILISIEMTLSFIQKKKYYTLADTFTNVYLTSLNMGLDILVRGGTLFALNYFYQFSPFTYDNLLIYWILLFVAEDFLYFVLHYVDHHSRFFWAVHVTHHSSNTLNFTVGFRSSVFQPLYRFVYFIPLALMGFKAIDIMFIYSATQIWGIIVHTRFVGRLGFLEKFMVTPSHHRVHHGANTRYLDKNIGMALIIWDKIFGTFQTEEEHDPVKYGLTKEIDSRGPINIVFHEWKAIWKDVKKTPSWRNKLMYIFGPPGWSHDGCSKTSAEMRKELQTKEAALVVS